DEPLLRVWMQERGEGDGRWVAETAWPSPRITPTSYALDPGRLVETAGPETRLEWRSPQSVGLAAGDWCAIADADGPTDQRAAAPAPVPPGACSASPSRPRTGRSYGRRPSR